MASKIIKGVLRPSEFLALLYVQFLALLSSFSCAIVQFPCAAVQFPPATAQFPWATVQFLALLSSLYFSFRVSRKQGIFVLLFRQTTHLSIPVYLFFQIRTLLSIFWAQAMPHIPHVRFDFLKLLSSSSHYCQFLAFLLPL